jgi:tetratricopeptide (TPR) repeat protein
MEKKLAKEFNNRGFDLFKQNKYKESLIEFDKALELNSTYKEAYYNKALALFLLRRHSDSLTSINNALQINEKYSKAQNLKGLILTDLNRFYEAALNYEKYPESGIEEGSYYYNKGISLANFNYSAAIENFKKAIDQNFDIENCRKEILQLECKKEKLELM